MKILITAAIAFIGIAILILRPVPIPDEKDCVSITGTVIGIYEGGVKDVVFKLQGHNQTFYINRGLEAGLNLNELRSTLMNQEIVIKYPDYWTPLDPGNSVRHISKVEFEGETVYTELEKKEARSQK
jgi:hypothetical protein